MHTADDLAQLLDRVAAWTASDPDSVTRRDAESLADRARAGDHDAIAALADAFDGRLVFGTAGLRGELGAGPRRMNRVVVRQSSAGLAAYLNERAVEGLCASPPVVVIGHDARRNSEVFARDAAAVFAGAGLRALLLPGPCPTPLTAFAVRHLHASAGVMITASHNPPNDNGYKVYLGDGDAGSQIIPPVDGRIAAHIDRIAALHLSQIALGEDVEHVGYGVIDDYIAETSKALRADSEGFGAYGGRHAAPQPEDAGTAVHAQAGSNAAPSRRASRRADARPTIAEAPGRHRDAELDATTATKTPGISIGSPTGPIAVAGAPDLRVVYTAMHGVGAAISTRLYASLSLPTMIPVPEQVTPDGTFPTVSFPNPEEPGALDLAIRTAKQVRAHLIVAQDPDADRLAIAAPDPVKTGEYRALTGNELGLLLGWRAADRAQRRALVRNEPLTGALACTIVSSPALAEVARAYGLEYVETLSGFKWVSRVPNLVFGFEEALGYLTHPSVVRDKDGISASADAITLVRELRAEGRTLWDLLDDAALQFGHFASGQVTLRFDSMAEASALAARVRHAPPRSFGAFPVAAMHDLLVPGVAVVPADVLRFDLTDGSRVMVRPSGTEAKLKTYIDCRSVDGSAAERRAAAEARLAEVTAGVQQWFAESRETAGE